MYLQLNGRTALVTGSHRGTGAVIAQQLAEEAGRDPESFEFGQFGTPPKAEIVDALIEAGIHRAVFSLPPADADTVLPKLDKLAEFAKQYA